MKLIKLITMTFVFALGLLVPAGMVHADRCDRSSDNANTTHPDNDNNGDHNCPVDATTTVATDVPPTPLPSTGPEVTAVVVAGIAAVSAGAVLLVARKKR